MRKDKAYTCIRVLYSGNPSIGIEIDVGLLFDLGKIDEDVLVRDIELTEYRGYLPRTGTLSVRMLWLQHGI